MTRAKRKITRRRRKTPPLPMTERYRLCLEHQISMPTLLKILRGEKSAYAGAQRTRVEQALRAEGILPPLPESSIPTVEHVLP